MKKVFPSDGFSCSGIDLRDWFASMAISGLVNHNLKPIEIAKKCYEIADELLRERRK
jgi:hypothetical protein